MAIAVNCIDDITTKVKKVAALSPHTHTVYSEEDLLDKNRFMQLPAVGVLYEGITAVPESSGQGMSGRCRVALVLVVDGKSVGNLDKKAEAIELLDAMRKCIRMTDSPSNHRWVFLSETPLGLVGNVLIYVQRWATPVQLTN